MHDEIYCINLYGIIIIKIRTKVFVFEQEILEN